MGIEQTALALDASRKALMVPQIDFDRFMADREKDYAAIKAPEDFAERVREYFSNGSHLAGVTLPWSKSHDLIRIRPGEVSCWHGYNGHGKSQILGQVVNHMAKAGEVCCIASFEMHPYKTLARMTRQALGANQPTPEYLDKYLKWLRAKVWMYDQQGTVNGDRVIAVILYCCKEFGVTQFVVDSLMKCSMNRATSHDTYTTQSAFVDKLCAVAKDTNCHIHLIAHDKKPEDEGAHPHKYMILGSSEISNQVDNCFGVWRNKKKEHSTNSDEAEPDSILICDKQRNGEWEGNINLWFDKESYRYMGAPHERTWGVV